jgi:hypothetical protein
MIGPLKFLILASFFVTFILLPNKAWAVYDPISVPNNKFGIHILYPSEISDASKLVNSSNGDWGYVTVPIQTGDKDLLKWQKFMDDCKNLHLIPIIKLASEGDYFNTKVWRKPLLSDVLDFSNFLSSLNWPTKNRYIIVFNEVNRADEWGGNVNPSDYAQILSYAVTVFKSNSQDFFIISSGMDNASANTGEAMNEYDYFSSMNASVPGIFNQIDGISSHSYPNPGFSQPSSFLSTKTIDTFYYEKRFVEGLSSKTFPVFITETGWDSEKLSKDLISSFYKEAFEKVWNDNSIIAVTPFIYSAGSGPFTKFSFVDPAGSPNEIHNAYASIPKFKGTPLLPDETRVLSSNVSENLPVKDYSGHSNGLLKLDRIEKVVKSICKV